MSYLSVAQLSTMLAVTKRTVQRRVVCENWPFEVQTGLGGQKRMFELSNLPLDVRHKVSAYIMRKHEQMGRDYESSGKLQESDVFIDFVLEQNQFISRDKAKPNDWISMHCFAHELEIQALDKDYVKMGLIVLARLYVKCFALQKIKGFDMFCQLYNQRKLSININIYSLVPRVSRITLLRWEKQKDLSKMAGQTVNQDGQSYYFEHDLQQIAQDILMISTNVTATQLKSYFKTIYPNRRTPSIRAISRWLKHRKQAQS